MTFRKRWRDVQFWWHKRRAPPLPWEWLEVCDSARLGLSHYFDDPACHVNGWIPRWVAEGLGIDCREWDQPIESRGHTWFQMDQAAALRISYWWRTPEQFESHDRC